MQFNNALSWIQMITTNDANFDSHPNNFKWKSLSKTWLRPDSVLINCLACKKKNQEVEHKHNAINGLTDDQFVKEFWWGLFWIKWREGMKSSDI